MEAGTRPGSGQRTQVASCGSEALTQILVPGAWPKTGCNWVGAGCAITSDNSSRVVSEMIFHK